MKYTVPTVKCWRCEKRFPESRKVRTVAPGVSYIDRYINVTDHWLAEHSNTHGKIYKGV